MNWILGNLATIVISLILIAAVTGIVIGMRRDKKKGKSLCGAKCGSCPMSGSCHAISSKESKGNP